MNWKVFLTACVSTLLLLSFPQNMIGCGGEIDPYDYYTTFFNKNSSEVKGYQPFYYTSLLTFYDDQLDPVRDDEQDPLLQEWIIYTRKNIPIADAADFLYSVNARDVESIQATIARQQSLQLPDSVSRNGMTRYFLDSKDSTALQYLICAKKTEPFCTTAGDWEAKPVRDSALLNGYIGEATHHFNKSKEGFLKNKYAFLRCKLAFYNHRYADCIRWCDETFTDKNNSAVQTMAHSYKAGSLFRLGKKAEAAYIFSKAFAESGTGKKKIFLGFLWATDFCSKELEERYSALCRNNEEKANMLSMFALYGVAFRLETLQKVYTLNPAAPQLDILAIREINKLEEQYLTPQLNSEKKSRTYYSSWNAGTEKPANNEPLVRTLSFFETCAADSRVNNRGLYYALAAYASFINKDYDKTRTLIAAAKKIKLTAKVSDQLQLLSLLAGINEKKQLDTAAEASILPAIQWLEDKSKKDEAYKLFYRNLFSEIIANKYQQQKDQYKAALAYGTADRTPVDNFSYSIALDFVREEMNSEQLLKLYGLFDSGNLSPFDRYLVSHASFSKNQVIDVIGTSYLRDFNFAAAISWLKKTNSAASLETDNYNFITEKESHVNVDPFYDYINDWNRYDKSLQKSYTKLTFAQKLLDLRKSLDTAKTNEGKSAIYYRLATAFYNMSYYGNAWMAVAFSRSNSDWNQGHYSSRWQREYYGVYKAGEYYQKAYDLSSNREFKAAALFLQAKCLQRQIPLPAYNYSHPDSYEKEMNDFQKKFSNNRLFPKFREEFGDTKFYKYASNRCSYLRDFVNK